MFTQFFYTLRNRKVPVSITEWMTFMEALDRGFVRNLDDFYFLARAMLVKSEAFYDHFDVAFQEYFQGLKIPPEIFEQLLDWLRDPVNRAKLEMELKGRFDKLTLDELLKKFEEKLKEQKEQHDGGSRWIGRGGTSPFGHSGYHPNGIRVGGESFGGRAVKIAQERRFRNLRNDVVLDTRQIKVALKRLRQLTRTGPEDELNLDGTIKATAQNAGELELKWQRARKNTVKVLLLMDVGGSMEPYSSLCSRIFSAAHSSTHFKDLKYYYFHNCIYDNLYKDIERRDATSTDELLHTLEQDYKVILVGDARMGIWELTDRYGAIYYYENNEIPGVTWMRRFAEHFTHCVWLNPESERFWVAASTQMIQRVFPMYPLTIDGLEQAVRKLVVRR